MSPAKDFLESLFASNRLPSLHESSVAGERLQICNQILRVVDTRIAALERELEELKAQRAIIEGERYRYADILSARRLPPPEIIARFMELACVDDNESESTQCRGAHHQVPSFMLVSREWYTTACGVARFWTELDMDLRNSSAQEIQEIMLKAANQSARASQLPLSLNIAFSALAPNGAQIVDFIHSLIPHLGLFNLRIQIGSISKLQILYSIFHHPSSSGDSALVWPMLHTLKISIEAEKEITADFVPPFPSAKFPVLRTAAISSPNVTLASYQMPWSNLLSLDLGPLPQLESLKYISILRECTNLRFLRLITQRQIDRDMARAIPVIPLPHLTHLHVENSDPGDTRCFLGRLRLPSLRSCIYHVPDPGSYYTTVPDRLRDLFRRSGCSKRMESLDLDLAHGTFFNPSSLENLLLEVPRLTVLKLSGYEMEGNPLQGVAPSVRELSIHLRHGRIDDARGVFVDYLNSRFAPSFVSYLKSRFTSCSDVPFKARLQLADTLHTSDFRKRLDSLQKKVGSSLDVVMV